MRARIDPIPERPRRWSLLAAVAILTGLSFAAFAWSFDGPFDFDDIPAIVTNHTIQPGKVARAPFATPPLGAATSGRPVVNLSFALNGAVNRALGIDRPTGLSSPEAASGFRLTNLLLHLATALLLFAIVRDTLVHGRMPPGAESSFAALRMVPGADRAALVVAAVWLVHPLQTEAVNYVAQRTEIVASLCYLTTLSAAIRHRRGPHTKRWLVVATLAALLGAGSKEIIVTVPIVVALYDRAFVVTTWRGVFQPASRRWLYLALTAAVAPCVIADLRGARADTVGAGTAMSTIDYLVTQGWAIPRYLRLMIVPNGLSYDYGRAPMLGVPSWIGLATLIIAGGLTLALWRKPQRHWLAFLGTTFFLLLAPSSSFVPFRTEIAAERRVYLALAVVVILAGVMAMKVVNKLRPPLVGATLALIVLALVITSARRSAMYRDPLLLWTDATRAVPTNARAFDNAGSALLRADTTRAVEADSLFSRALALDSTYLDSWIKRAAIATKRNRLADAETMYRHALRIAPNDSQAVSLISKLYLAAGRPALAVPYLKQLAARSDDPDAFVELGNAYFLLRQLDSAALILGRALSINPRDASALRWMGATLLEQGSVAQAIPYLERALWADSTSAFTYALLGSALLATGDLEGAERMFDDAVRIDRRDPELWTRLAVVQARRGRRTQAMTSVKQALTLAPDYPPAREALGLLR
jgi:tetratricopeptide (TPR) repeat protein/drug/metabolite transporter superfamily protein YnfA